LFDSLIYSKSDLVSLTLNKCYNLSFLSSFPLFFSGNDFNEKKFPHFHGKIMYLLCNKVSFDKSNKFSGITCFYWIFMKSSTNKNFVALINLYCSYEMSF
jgi:hypothetical protein